MINDLSEPYLALRTCLRISQKHNTDSVHFWLESAKQPYWATADENRTCSPFQLPEKFELEDRSNGTILCRPRKDNNKKNKFCITILNGRTRKITCLQKFENILPTWPDPCSTLKNKSIRPKKLFSKFLNGLIRKFIELNVMIENFSQKFFAHVLAFFFAFCFFSAFLLSGFFRLETDKCLGCG